MKVSGTLVDASSHCKDMTGVSYHCYVCLCLHAHVSLGQETITDTSKYTHYMATTCLSLIFQTWLSQDHARLTMIPVNLTVPAHLCCNRTPDVALAVTNWSQPVKGRHNQVEAVVLLLFHSDGQHTPVSTQGVLDGNSVHKHGWMCCPIGMMWEFRQRKNKNPTLVMLPIVENGGKRFLSA